MLQALFPPSIRHVTVVVELPAVGVVSGSAELNVIVPGLAVTVAGLTAATKCLLKIRGNNSREGALQAGVGSNALAAGASRAMQNAARIRFLKVGLIVQ